LAKDDAGKYVDVVAELIVELFEKLDYTVQRDVRLNFVEVDLVIVSRDGVASPVEIRSWSKAIGVAELERIASHLRTVTFSDGLVSPIIVVLPGITTEAKRLASTQPNLRIWDAATLLDKSRPFPDLRKRLSQRLRTFVKVPDVEPEQEPAAAALIKRLEDHIASNAISPQEYEQLCQQVFTYVFDPDLYDFRPQIKTTDGANRYDFICKIRSGKGNDFWDTLKRDFRTRALLFECKNYNEKITADQVYSTERYLFSSALRTVCFLISRLGPNEGCISAAQGAMREAGKLILLLSNVDMIELVRLKVEENGPENYLDEKIWNFVISLPR
jgi:hypothetical protein